MEFRFHPYNSLKFLVIVGIILVCHLQATAQCDDGKFTYQSVSSANGLTTGKIEVIIQNPDAGVYTFKVYEMAGTLSLVQTRQAPSPEKITFDNLKAATYFIKVEWGESCQKALGGLDGITVTETDQKR